MGALPVAYHDVSRFEESPKIAMAATAEANYTTTSGTRKVGSENGLEILNSYRKVSYDDCTETSSIKFKQSQKVTSCEIVMCWGQVKTTCPLKRRLN